MLGGTAKLASRRSAAPEPAARSRTQRTSRAAPPAAVAALAPAPTGRMTAPTTRDRLQASFATSRAAPALAVVPARAEPEPVAGAGAGAALALPASGAAGEGATTRDRIAARARAVEPATTAGQPAAAPLAEVVEIAVLRDRRDARQAGAPASAAPDEPAVVSNVRSMPAAARGPPAPAQPTIQPTPSPLAADATPTATTATAGTGEPATASAPTTVAEPLSAGSVDPASAGIIDPASASGPAQAPAAGPAPSDAASPASATAPAFADPRATAAAPGDGAASEAAAATAVQVIRNPEDEPGFKAMRKRSRAAASAATAHQPAAEGAATAQAAAQPPANELESQAAANQVAVMGEQEPGEFDARAFVAAVKAAIEAATPQTLEDTDEFKESGAVADATAEVAGLVAGGKASSQSAIQAATAADPDLANTVSKPVSEMVNDDAGPPLPTVGAAGAMPGPRPDQQTDVSAGPAEIDARMTEQHVTEHQLAIANEPDFSAALQSREAAHEHARTAPLQTRAEEQAILADARGGAAAASGAQLESIHGVRAGTLGAVLGRKDDAKLADEAQRAQVATDVQALYARTKTDVEAILSGLDTKVDDEFTSGERDARTTFENYVEDRLSAYRAERYSGLGGGALWLKDCAFDMPEEVNEFYVQGRSDYLDAMDGVIERIASIVAAELAAARARIVEGRSEVQAFVVALPDSLREVGEDCAGQLETQFDMLTSDIDTKQAELVDAVARRYVESRDAVDARIEELKEANKGWVSTAYEFFAGVFSTVAALREMLMNVLAKAAEVIGDIIADPIGFLGNLIDGIMGGLNGFVDRIGIHLQNAFTEWLFGAIAGAGITLPEQLDLAGIFDIVTQVLGLTYDNIRARVALVVGEPVVAEMEQLVDVFKTLATDGISGIWESIKDRFADLEEMVLGQIKEWIVENVIKGGVAWIIGLLNPVTAFIKACRAIYDIVMFVVQRGSEIMDFVNSVLDSIGAIARGDIDAAVKKVEGSLANALPLAISFLAGLLGLGGLSEQIASIIARVRKPVERAIDATIMGIAKAFKRSRSDAPQDEPAPADAWLAHKQPDADAWLAKKPAIGDEYLQKGKPGAGSVKEAQDDYAAQPHDPQQALEPEPPAGPLVIDEDFRSDGKRHELHTVPGGDDLVVESVPTPLTQMVDPATGVPDPSLLALARDFHVKFAAYEAALAARAANPKKRSGWTVRLREVKAVVKQIIAELRALGMFDLPGASAPGIGHVGAHGRKPPSLRNGPPVWWLESEHIIPYAVGKLLWDAAGELTPHKRGRRPDRNQTTVMIYKGAATQKTKGDGKLIKDATAQYRAVLHVALQTRLDAAQAGGGIEHPPGVGDYSKSTAASSYGQGMKSFHEGLDKVRLSAVTATKDAIHDEHGEPKAPQTNGKARAEPDPLPAPNSIDDVSLQQHEDVMDLARETLELGG